MPRNRGAESQRHESRRARGEHAESTAAADHVDRRARAHSVAEPTTDSFQIFLNQASRYTRLTREPDDEEGASRAKLPLDEVRAVRDLTRVTTSLDAPVGEGDTTLGELRSESSPSVEAEVTEREQDRAIGTALATLPEDER